MRALCKPVHISALPVHTAAHMPGEATMTAAKQDFVEVDASCGGAAKASSAEQLGAANEHVLLVPLDGQPAARKE